MAKVEAPCLPASLIHLADVNSFAGNRGKLSQKSYNRYVDRIMRGFYLKEGASKWQRQ